MRPRQDIATIFSSYIQFENDYFGGWLTEPRLLRSMEACLPQAAQEYKTKHTWAMYWHQLPSSFSPAPSEMSCGAPRRWTYAATGPYYEK
jgi:hypothetical protein